MKPSTLEILNIAGGIASVLGLLVSLYTLYKVSSLPAALRQHSRDRLLTDLIDKINRMKPASPALTDPTAREVEMIVKTIRLYYLSPWPFGQRSLRALLRDIEAELRGEKHREVLQHHLRLIRDEILIR